MLCTTHCIWVGILLVLFTEQYFRRVDTIYATHYPVLRGLGTIDAMYYAVYLGGDTLDTMHHAVSSEGGYYLCYALPSIFGGWLILILCTTQYIGGGILWILCTTQYFWGVVTIDNMHHAVNLWVYC